MTATLAATRAAGGAFLFFMTSTRVSMAVAVWACASSRTSATTLGRPPGLPDCPGLNWPLFSIASPLASASLRFRETSETAKQTLPGKRVRPLVLRPSRNTPDDLLLDCRALRVFAALLAAVCRSTLSDQVLRHMLSSHCCWSPDGCVEDVVEPKRCGFRNTVAPAARLNRRCAPGLVDLVPRRHGVGRVPVFCFVGGNKLDHLSRHLAPIRIFRIALCVGARADRVELMHRQFISR